MQAQILVIGVFSLLDNVGKLVLSILILRTKVFAQLTEESTKWWNNFFRKADSHSLFCSQTVCRYSRNYWIHRKLLLRAVDKVYNTEITENQKGPFVDGFPLDVYSVTIFHLVLSGREISWLEIFQPNFIVFCVCVWAFWNLLLILGHVEPRKVQARRNYIKRVHW